MPKIFVYGRSHAPKSWHETAEVLKTIKKAKRPKGNKLGDQLDKIEQMLKDTK